MQPLYFLPNRTMQDLLAGDQLKREELERHGLNEIFADVGTLGVDVVGGELVGPGPGGQTGAILVPFTPGKGGQPQSTYHADVQDWQPVGDGSRLWIGLHKNSPPKPEDLERKTTFAGYGLAIEGVGKLDLPIVRRPDGTTGLPRRMNFENGQFIQRIRQQYEPLWDALGEVTNWAFNAGPLATEQAVRLALRVLSLNYRYDMALHNRLDWIDSENFFVVLMAAVDKPAVDRALDEREKKRSLSMNDAVFHAWRRGYLPDHAPSWGELYACMLFDSGAADFAEQLAANIAGLLAPIVARRNRA